MRFDEAAGYDRPVRQPLTVTHTMANNWQQGTQVGPYRLDRILGQGGAGQVWLATDARLNRTVAIKTIASQGHPYVVTERFGREARALARVPHPGIVQVYDVGRDEDRRYIVTEYVNGADLGTIIGCGVVRLGWAVHIARQVVDALEYAHQQGVIHRDIKPSNILVDGKTDQAKLTDFGLAKPKEEAAAAQTLTGPNAFAGTPAYMAPEQFGSAKVSDARADIFSLGATLYDLFTGRPPPNVVERFAGGVGSATKLVAPRELRPDIPQALSDAIVGMLEPDPGKRLSLIELRGVLSKLNIPVPQGGPLEERAIETPQPRPQAPAVTVIGQRYVPTGFFDATVFAKSQFFGDDSTRFSKIQESLKFYRDHLNSEYQNLLRQATMTYRLWLACVGLGFLVLLAGIITMLAGRIPEGAATTAATVIVYFIQRVFQQREDHYRTLANSKNSHLEYGNHWLLVIQSIDSMENAEERADRQSKLVDVLTQKLGASSGASGATDPQVHNSGGSSPPKPRPGRATKKRSPD